MYLLWTLFFILGTACFAKVLHFSIQPGQWLDRLAGWQKRVNSFGMKTGFINEIGYKAMGGCEFCFAHAVSFFSFWAYLLTMINTGLFPSVFWLIYIFIYLLYVCLSTVLSTLLITRL